MQPVSGVRAVRVGVARREFSRTTAAAKTGKKIGDNRRGHRRPVFGSDKPAAAIKMLREKSKESQHCTVTQIMPQC